MAEPILPAWVACVLCFGIGLALGVLLAQQRWRR